MQPNLLRSTTVLILVVLPVSFYYHLECLFSTFQIQLLYPSCLNYILTLQKGRSKKKKCGEERPVCRRCRRNPSEQCVWESCGPRHSRGSARPSQTPAASSQIVLFSKKLESDDCSSLSQMGRTTQNIETVPRHPTSHLAQIDGFDRMKFLLNTFSETSSLPYVRTDAALLTHSIPCALDSPPLMHSYVACGAALLSRPGSPWGKVAIDRYNKAVNFVRDELCNYKQDESHEWLLATVHALHIFEVSNSFLI